MTHDQESSSDLHPALSKQDVSDMRRDIRNMQTTISGLSTTIASLEGSIGEFSRQMVNIIHLPQEVAVLKDQVATLKMIVYGFVGLCLTGLLTTTGGVIIFVLSHGGIKAP